MNLAVVVTGALCIPQIAAFAQDYDLVIRGGRVIDPETSLDARRNVGIRGKTIAAVTGDAISGRETIDATGLVVAPGFIDLHAHGQNAESRLLQAADGVTTALELEIGVYPVKPWYESQAGTSLINYGATVGHMPIRMKIFDNVDIGHPATAPSDLRTSLTKYTKAVATDDEIKRMSDLLREGMREGALGLGYGVAYVPTASHREIYETFKVGAEFDAPIFVHMRDSDAFSDKESIGCVQEVVANAAATGARLHIVHLGSSGGKQAKACLDLIRGAAKHGVDVTTEVYPWNASSTRLESALFDGDWGARSGLKFSDIMWTKTGERLTKETFDKYRKVGGWVVLFGQDEELVSWLVAQPEVIIASDGIPFVDGKAHPRGAGTFSRTLGKYTRDEKRLDLMTALKKMTLLPAQRLAKISPQMNKKGRLQVGMDADITVFNADTIQERATYTEPAQHSAGIEFVLVNGVPVVRNNKTVDGVHPGEAIVGIGTKK